MFESKDPHYTTLDMGRVEESEAYTRLRYSSSKPEWNEVANSSVIEYAVPPDAIGKLVGVSGEFVGSDTAKTVATAFGASSKSASAGITAVPVGQVKAKDKSAGKKKALQPKATPGGKKSAPLALSNPTTSNKKEKPPPATAEASTAATKQTGKGKQPLIPPTSSSQHQPAAMNVASGGVAPGKVTVAHLAKRLEKGAM